jgi:hypothetical protein
VEINPKEILKYVEARARYKGETKAYWDSISKLPEYDHSKFYAVYSDYDKNILQGDGIANLKFINLPNEDIETARGIVLSNTCDIELENKRKFPTRIIYAPLLKLSAYRQMLIDAKKRDGDGTLTDESKFSEEQVDAHIDEIRKQKVSQIFYLPTGRGVSEEVIVFFDNLCSSSNESVPRDSLSETRMFSLSAYGWHVFLVRLSHFFTKFSDETVELRFNPAT